MKIFLCFTVRLSDFLADRFGGTAIEYALIIGLISTAVVLAMTSMGSTLDVAYAHFALSVGAAE